MCEISWLPLPLVKRHCVLCPWPAIVMPSELPDGFAEHQHKFWWTGKKKVYKYIKKISVLCSGRAELLVTLPGRELPVLRELGFHIYGPLFKQLVPGVYGLCVLLLCLSKLVFVGAAALCKGHCSQKDQQHHWHHYPCTRCSQICRTSWLTVISSLSAARIKICDFFPLFLSVCRTSEHFSQ